MSDADLAEIALTAFETECARMNIAVLIALAPRDDVASMPEGRLMLHHHAALAVLSEILSDLIAMTSDDGMRQALRASVIDVIDGTKSKGLH